MQPLLVLSVCISANAGYDLVQSGRPTTTSGCTAEESALSTGMSSWNNAAHTKMRVKEGILSGGWMESAAVHPAVLN